MKLESIIKYFKKKMKKKSQLKKLIPLTSLCLMLGIILILAIPLFTDILTPTGQTENKSIIAEYNISCAGGCKEFKFNWNGTNTTIFDDSVVFMSNFDNLTSLDESDNLVVDISKYGNNGTVVGAVWNSTGGKYGGAFEFDGVDDYIDIEPTPNIYGLDNHTYSAWVYVKGGNTNAIIKSVTSGKTRWFNIEGSSATVLVYSNNANSSSYKRWTCSLTSGIFNSWHHVSLVWHDNITDFYVDGELKCKDTTYSGDLNLYSNYFNNTLTDLKIGEGYDFNGSIDEFMIFNKSLSANEIKKIYDSQLIKYDSTNWNFWTNQSLDDADPNSTTTSYSYPYYLCSIDSTDSENCTIEKTITRVPESESVIGNFTNSVGVVRNEFYGANTHARYLSNGELVDTNNDGVRETLTNTSWHRETWLNANMDNQRGDMYLSNFYTGIGNKNAESWIEGHTTTLINKSKYCVSPSNWGCGSWNAQGNYTNSFGRSNDAHSGSYSVNITNNATQNSIAFNYIYVGLESGHNYNFSVWVKSNNPMHIIAGWNDGSVVACTDTCSGSGNWEQLSCNFTSDGTYSEMRLSIGVGEGESGLWDDVNFTEDGIERSWFYNGGLQNQTDLVEWVYNNNQKINYITISIPDFLGNQTTDCVNVTDMVLMSDCEILDKTSWIEILEHYINTITNNKLWIDAVEIEVHNEPYHGSWLEMLGYDNVDKAIKYAKHYNLTYNGLKDIFPTLEIGGPSGFRNAPIMTTTFLSNASSMGYSWDFISTHPYASSGESNWYVNSNQLYLDIKSILDECNTYGVSCNRIIASEVGEVDRLLKNDSTYSDRYSLDIAYAYQSILNTYPGNVTIQWYQWGENYKYSNTIYFPEYSHKYLMVSEPQLDNEYTPLYNTTKAFATNHPAGATIYKTSSTDSTLKTVSSKKGNAYSYTIINTDEEARNTTIYQYPAERLHNLDTAEVFTLSGQSSNLGIIDTYNILYLGSGVYGDFDNFYFDKDSNLVTETDGTNNLKLTNTHTSNQEIRIYNLTNALIYNSNGSIYGSSNINNNDGNVNGSLNAGSSNYILNNFNLTEGQSRNNSPIWYESSSTNYSKYIKSNLTSMVNLTVQFYVDNCSISSISFISATGDYMITNYSSWTCTTGSDSIVTLTAPYLEGSLGLEPDLEVSLGSGISALEFRPRHAYDRDVWAVNQTNIKGVFNITNNGTALARTIGIKYNQTQAGWGIECNNQTSGSWINLTTNYQTIYTDLSMGNSFQTWCRADLYNPQAIFRGKILFNITL